MKTVGDEIKRLHRNYGIALAVCAALLGVQMVVDSHMQVREYLRGQREGYALARRDQENVDRQMADIGLCKWARLILERDSCKK